MTSLVDRAKSAFPARVTGEIHRLLGLAVEARGLHAPIGARCEIFGRGSLRLEAEVVGVHQESTLVAPLGDIRGLMAGDRIVYSGKSATVRVGSHLIGHVVDSCCRPLDASEDSLRGEETPLHGATANPMRRRAIERPFVTGVRAIDGLCTVGQGQRMGVFSGSGVGKSVLLGTIAGASEADIVVIGLIGERSREVREFVERQLGEDGLKRSIVVVATSDEPALLRLQAALVSTAIAEHFRDRGRNVLLVLDSLTRVAMAQREIGLSSGEPPATRGYPPSVFATIPRLLERARPSEQGTITAFYGVLVESDDRNDPIADCARGVLDGHLWLSRDLAERGYFPAIDPLSSLSRPQSSVVTEAHRRGATAIRAHLARYRQVEDLIRLGAFVTGSDPEIDRSVELIPRIESLLQQGTDERSAFDDTVASLTQFLSDGHELSESESTKVTTGEVTA